MAGTDAYAGYCLAAGSFLAMGYALREGDHIRVTLILQRLSGRARWWMEVLCLVVATLLSSYFAFYAGKLVWDSYVFKELFWIYVGLSGALYQAIRRHVPSFRVAFGGRDLARVVAVDAALLAATAAYTRLTLGY
jgi:hypothetical protein